ncbi:MAG: universal stress protein [Pseudomonadota bacterium]
MIRKVMMPVRGDGKGDNVLRHAATLAHAHSAHIEITHCRPRPEDLMPYGIPVPDFLRKQLVAQSYELADTEEAKLRGTLETYAGALDLVDDGAARGTRATYGWIEEVGRQVDVIKRHGRLADIVAVAQPDRDRNLGMSTLKAALFHSGRPVLMCPERKDQPQSLGKSIAIAWNGSAEAARAVAQSMFLIRHATRVAILSSGMDAGPGTTAEDLKSYLNMHDAEGDIVPFDAGKSAGAALLKVSAEIDADVLIMGAYSDSHERETIFGGNTQTIVDHAKMPILLSH